MGASAGIATSDGASIGIRTLATFASPENTRVFIRQLFSDLGHFGSLDGGPRPHLNIAGVASELKHPTAVTPVLVTGVHVSLRAVVAIVSRHCALSTFARAAQWIPATRAGMTPEGEARSGVITSADLSTARVPGRMRSRRCTKSNRQGPFASTVSR